MNKLLLSSVAQNASDLHLSSGLEPIIRVNGELKKLFQDSSNNILTAHELEDKLFSLLTDSQQCILQENKQLDFAHSYADGRRARGNIFYQQNGISAVFRLISDSILSLEAIHAPAIFYDLIHQNQGLILVTGATGSGKSTTLATLIQEINQTQSKHIITFEDPIEFIFTSQSSLIQQREIAIHMISFKQALNAVLRQDPDIILMGELRDSESIQAALTAAETGHLVFATLHTNSAIGCLERLVDVFPGEDKNFVRTQLSHSLRAIISQKLVRKKVEGRRAIYEILVNTPAVSHLIREGKNNQIETLMQTGKQYGMNTMEQALADCLI